MPKNNAYNIIERRSKVIMLLAEGKSQVQIASILNESPQLIHDDIKAIQRDAEKYISKNLNKNIAYLLYVTLNNNLRVNQEAWKIYSDKKTSARDKLYALKIVLSANDALIGSVLGGMEYKQTLDLENEYNILQQKLENRDRVRGIMTVDYRDPTSLV